MESRTYTSDIAFTPAVKAQQERLGSRAGYAKMEAAKGWQSQVTDDLAQFIAARDSFYLGTANADGQPYIQHRGGQPGFLKVIGERTLAFADYSGNRQYITVGALTENDKAFIFLMDYPNRRRVKIWGRARFVEDDPHLLKQVCDPDEDAPVERAIVFEVDAWDVNCPKHISPRYTEAELAPAIGAFQSKIEELKQQNRRLEEKLSALQQAAGGTA